MIELDLERGAMLLENLDPGTPVHALMDDGRATSIAADVMRQLWRSPPDSHFFPSVTGWGHAFARHRAEHGVGAGPLPGAVFDLGEALYHELDASTECRVLLNGDLHHDNILAAQRHPWLANDPKGVVGDPAFEVGPLLLNLWEDLYRIADPVGTLSARVDRLAAELGFPRSRVRDWGIAHCVLSAVWSAEGEGTGWEPAIERAEQLLELRD